MHIAILCISAVAICTERVEAKSRTFARMTAAGSCNLHGACGGKDGRFAAQYTCRGVAICTERVEAKDAVGIDRNAVGVAICTERVEAKTECLFGNPLAPVAICTERVEAKMPCAQPMSLYMRCNLHGACGGKEQETITFTKQFQCCNLHGACGGKDQSPARCFLQITVAICTERVEAKVFFSCVQRITLALQSARSVWRQRS